MILRGRRWAVAALVFAALITPLTLVRGHGMPQARSLGHAVAGLEQTVPALGRTSPGALSRARSPLHRFHAGDQLLLLVADSLMVVLGVVLLTQAQSAGRPDRALRTGRTRAPPAG